MFISRGNISYSQLAMMPAFTSLIRFHVWLDNNSTLGARAEQGIAYNLENWCDIEGWGLGFKGIGASSLAYFAIWPEKLKLADVWILPF